jgi:ATP-binding cassette subfamily F protein 3
MAKGKLRRVSDELHTEGQAISIKRAKDKLKELRRPDGEWDRMNIDLQAKERSGLQVLQVKDLVFGYDTPLGKIPNIKLYRGEIAALIGPNGAGKTTLLRTLLGHLEPLSGSIRLGESLKVGYFAQAHDNLAETNTVLDELRRHSDMEVAQARNYLARYLFREDDVFKQVSALSGGERARLALAILALDGANFLLLDEPTNHLDLPAQEVLQTVLENFDGTILLVSHDRYLVNRLATHIWDLRDGKLQVFKGGYQVYLDQRQSTRKTAVGQRQTATAG